ncbi:SDR family NAD(P)-dependent oxidoreductase [Streptomyces sp. SR27]|uniref:SDR family NAD(P)-dependent oxidoreductase n=1 Tax=Streptomyces sp. SR27 TaxID=3076630 RepID=UPI00295B31FF|nr:SDR family NAD(P)-dependent oxidoreductase [Streptomyces sp. SR27]MDV9190565.1 SDR family NAD(P)-dependent oxidoreductase [Streptomyces sp. SR27]
MSLPLLETPIQTRPLQGRNALVTGGATGIGAEIGRALATAGATVAVNHLGQDPDAHALLAAFERAGSPGIAFNADLTDPGSVRTMADLVRTEIGPVDILVNNAGSYPRVAWQDTDEAAWTYSLGVNLTAHYRTCHAFTPGMVERRWGRIVNIGSVNARAGRTNLVAYSTAKAGLLGLTRSLARELGPYGICVNTVLPGAIQVEAENTLPAQHRARPGDQIKRQCVPRRGRPEDVAALVAFLVGPLCLVHHGAVHPRRRRLAAPLRPSTSKETNRNDRTSPRRPRHRRRHDAGHPPNQAWHPRVLGSARRRRRAQ